MGLDERYMRRAIELAERGWGQVAPNPLVGAVVVADGEIVGEGFHARFGEEHAETVALREAGARAAGSTLYVNLEPCAHTGKTSACALAIGDAGVREVVVACRDPNPEAAGGLERLTAAGVKVRLGTAASEARRLNAPFFWRMTQELPYVALKLATSIDARIAAEPGARTALTGEAAAEEVHRIRAGYDAILVGRGTVAADDPWLTARGALAPRIPPVRIVLDTGFRLSPSSRLVATIDEAPVWVVGSNEADPERCRMLESAGVRTLRVEESGGRVALPAALKALAREGVGTVLVEGGARVASELLGRGLVHRLHVLIAPRFLGDDGVAAFAGVPPSSEGDWIVSSRRRLGPDSMIVFDSRAALERLAGRNGR
ncbi:MAG: bifunctional diaminohydroxyphosphoribosylaminopyrimidine deaminase/5-amino-6-(5-phosphoribosylamino)uracil reductase RibD [Gemmatimonadales bacterium]|jgi:diaminohydroxyphosphoribosylaminopyrimidine deaminase/5-amino-6-(5-phosphoribosylamino)uracil reductase